MGTQDIMDNYILSLSQNNSSIKLTGSYTLKQGAGLIIGFYSPIIENYFNVSNTTVSFQNTSGITSSSGKAIKFGFYKNSSAGTDKPLYLLFLMYQMYFRARSYLQYISAAQSKISLSYNENIVWCSDLHMRYFI